MAVIFVTAPDGPLGCPVHDHTTHLARACDLPYRHPERQANLRRPLPERQPEVPGGRGGARARRPDPDHARPRRPLGDTIELAEKFGCTDRRARRARRLAAWIKKVENVRDPNKGGTVDVDGVKVTLTHAQHSSSIESENGPLRRRAVSASSSRLEDGLKIYFAGDTNVFGDMALIAATLRARRRRAPDRRPLHDGPARGGRRARAAGREALRAVPLRHASRSSSARLRSCASSRPASRCSSPRPGRRSSCEGALVRRDRAARARARARRDAGRRGRAAARRRQRRAAAAGGARAGHAGRRPRDDAGRGEGRARTARGLGRARSRPPSLLELDLTELTYG